MSKKSQQDQERTEAIERLREWVQPGETVHTIVRHASKSGMSRTISAIICRPGDYTKELSDAPCEPVDISWAVARALDWRFDRDRGGVKVNGAGMDMGFHLVSSLSRVLFPEGFGIACVHCGMRPAAWEEAHRDAAEGGIYCQGREPLLPHERRGRNGESSGWDRDGGYALRHRWL